ncbi:MAG: LA_3696 family protein [Gemmatimonadales bacterium]
MPLTIKLSRRFYDALGEDVANEFVDALNNVDAAYRSELRDTVDQRFSQFETRIEAKLDQRLTSLRADLDIKWTERWTALDAKLDRGMEKLKSELLRWMFGFWVTTLGVLFLRS